MRKFEYQMTGVTYLSGNPALPEMNALGAEGWEMVAIVPGAMIWKRQIENAELEETTLA